MLYSSDQDSISEQSIQIILKKMCSIMIDQLIPVFLWPEIFLSMVTITNRTRTVVLEVTLYIEFMNTVDTGHKHQHQPFLRYLQVQGYKTYVLISKETRLQS